MVINIERFIAWLSASMGVSMLIPNRSIIYSILSEMHITEPLMILILTLSVGMMYAAVTQWKKLRFSLLVLHGLFWSWVSTTLITNDLTFGPQSLFSLVVIVHCVLRARELYTEIT